MKKIFLLLITLIIVLSSISCYPRYEIERPELYTVAVNSLLWNMGVSTATDFIIAPEISVIETDAYGRTLFQYTEKNFTTELAFSGLLILQMEDGDFVYYYEDQNFICKEKVSHSHVEVIFEEELIEELKAQNDWDSPINLDKCISKKISDKKEPVPISEDKLDEIFSNYEGYYTNKTFVLTSDGFGKTLIYSAIWVENGDISQTKFVVTLLKNGSFAAFFEPESLYEYQEDLREFKDLNGWGTYLKN